MKFFDPSRPRFSNGHPAIADPADPQGVYQGPIPELVITPDENGTLCIEVQLRSSYNGYRMAGCEIPPDQLQDFILKYLEDPELVLREHFGWTPLEFQSSAKPAEKSTTTLEDLGL